MKRSFVLLTAILLFFCADAMAAPFVNGSDVQNSSSANWTWSGTDSVLTILDAGNYIISDWGSTDAIAPGRIVVDENAGNVKMTLRNVHIQTSEGISCMYAEMDEGSIDLTIGDNVTLKTAGKVGVNVHVGNIQPSGVSIRITGENVRIHASDFGVYAQSTKGDARIDVGGQGADIRGGDYGVFSYSQDGEANVTVSGSGTKVYEVNHGIQAWSVDGNASVDIARDNVKISGNYSGISARSDTGDVRVSVSGKNTVITSDITGINAQSEEGAASVTLGENVTVSGGETAVFVVTNNDKPAQLLIDGERYPGIIAVSAGNRDGSGAAPLKNSPFYALSENVYDEVKGTKFLRTIWSRPEIIMPQTGDSSSLALWAFLLAIAGAGMTAMRKREA